MIIALVAAGVYFGLAGFAIQGRARGARGSGWLIVYCGYSFLLMSLHALILGDRLGGLPAPLSANLLVLAGFALSVCLTGALTLAYIETRFPAWLWAVAGVAWVAALAATFVPPEAGQAGAPISFDPPVGVVTWVALGGWAAIALFLLGLNARAFLRASLPLVANRILLWTLVAPVLLLGDALAGWFSSPWNAIGFVVRLLGAAGAVYAVGSNRGLDLRGAVRWGIRRVVVTLLTALVIAAAVVGSVFLSVDAPTLILRWLIVAGVALAAAILVQPLLELTNWVMRALASGRQVGAAEAVRLYSQKISTVIELRDLAAASVKTLNQLLTTRQGYMILAREFGDRVDLEVIGRMWGHGTRALSMPTSSPIHQYLVKEAKPLLQYDIRYEGRFSGAAEAERAYFDGLEMDIYAPIVNTGKLVGLLALGPKSNDQPYRPQEIDLLGALANQTVTVLENARLISDLRSLNEKNRLLNEDLRVMNERLGRMDQVKSDFISIASHELRTPLTQVQGYSDLIHEMVDRGAVDLPQLQDMTARLMAASERMAEVLNAMMDVTQIDVENMDMTFEMVKIGEVMKTALEPYQEAVVERKMRLDISGLDDLPSIEGDPRRLTQAFQNLLSNAIKFTPDGGKIDVSGVVLGKNEFGHPHSVQIIVTDQGIGIDKDAQQLIFEKFYRVGPVEFHSTGATKFKGAGPGLGLAIAKGIVDAHGGRIWVDSPGHDERVLPGSSFNVVLPIHAPAKDLRSRLQKMEAAGATRAGRSTDHFATKPGQRGANS